MLFNYLRFLKCCLMPCYIPKAPCAKKHPISRIGFCCDTLKCFRQYLFQLKLLLLTSLQYSSRILPFLMLLKSQSALERILIFQRCPVCQTYNNSSSSVCIECGFDEINKVFINKDEYELWLNEVVLPARQQREENNS